MASLNVDKHASFGSPKLKFGATKSFTPLVFLHH